MTNKPLKLTATQERILNAAAGRPDGDVDPLPPNVNAGIRKRVLEAMLSKALVTRFPGDVYRISTYGRQVIGKPALGARTRKRRAPAPRDAAKAKARPGTKQEALLSLLSRPEGASIDEMVAATGWQKHTVRGAMSHAIKKRLGIEIKSDKGNDGVRRYRV